MGRPMTLRLVSDQDAKPMPPEWALRHHIRRLLVAYDLEPDIKARILRGLALEHEERDQ